MEIISVSLDSDTLSKLNVMQRKLGFRSRSKLLRNAIMGVLKEYEGLDSLRGHIDVVFVLTYPEREKNHVSDILHGFKGMVVSELHQHTRGLGVDVLHISADAAGAATLFGTIKRSKCVRSATYTLISGTAR